MSATLWLLVGVLDAVVVMLVVVGVLVVYYQVQHL
jgi:hypothetical protein